MNRVALPVNMRSASSAIRPTLLGRAGEVIE
jgi:hypothetical protein